MLWDLLCWVFDEHSEAIFRDCPKLGSVSAAWQPHSRFGQHGSVHRSWRGPREEAVAQLKEVGLKTVELCCIIPHALRLHATGTSCTRSARDGECFIRGVGRSTAMKM